MQIRITADQIRRFEDALTALDRQERPATITPRLWQAQRDALLSQLEDLRRQLEEQGASWPER